MKRLCFILLAAAAGTVFAGIRAEPFRNGKTECIRVENEFYNLVIVPDIGARIFQWTNKVSGIAQVNLKIPSDPANHGPVDGLLDDRGSFWTMKYNCRLIRPDKNTVVLYLKVFDPARQLGIDRKMTFRAGSPVIRIRYRYENHSQRGIFGFDLGQRNFVQPSGKPVRPEDRYFLPSTHAVRKIEGFTLHGMRVPDLSGKLITHLGADWHAFLSVPKKSGFAVRHLDNWYIGWYVWKDHVDYPTWEWMYGDLPAGHARETEFDLIQVDGFDNLSYASRELLADMQAEYKDNELKVKLRTQNLAELPSDAILTTSIRKVASNWKTAAAPLPCRGNRFEQTFKLPGDGLYVVVQQIVKGKRVIAKWQDAIPCGADVRMEPQFTPEFSNITEPQKVAGWKGPDKDRLEISPEAEKRGFAITFPPQGSRYEECKVLTVKMARNEFESRELVLYDILPGGDCTPSCRPPQGVRLNLVPERRITLPGRSSGMVTRHARILDPRATLSGEGTSRFWLVFGGADMKPGKYEFPVNFTNQAGEKADIRVRLEVLDLALPGRKPVMMESEYVLTRHINSNPELLQSYFRNMASHDVDTMQYPQRGLTPKALPALDRTVDLALAAGITRFKAARYDVSAPKPQEVKNWKYLADFLHSKGIQDKDIFVKILDEQPADRFPLMAATGKWLKGIGFHPFSTFNMLFAEPENMKLLHPWFDMYQGGYVGPRMIAARRKDGLFKPGDRTGNYTGWGTCWQSYEVMMQHGIYTALLELDLFHNHEYMRGDNSRLGANIVMIGPDSHPLDSVAHEGLRDGIDLANFAACCRTWLSLLEKEPGYADSVREWRRKYDQIFGGIFRRKTLIYNGIEDIGSQSASFQDFEQGRNQLLDLLAEIKKATEGRNFGRIVWNGLTLWDRGRKFQVTGPGSDHFLSAFRKRFNLPDVRSDKADIEIVFKLGQPGGQSYRISREGRRIEIEAADQEHLQLAARNWLQTMDAAGIWE